jgi:hypothetical protein
MLIIKLLDDALNSVVIHYSTKRDDDTVSYLFYHIL